MKGYAAAYVGTLVAMAILDLLWLGWIAQPLYAQALGHLMAPRTNLPAAALFYAVYALGVVIFAVMPQAGRSAKRILAMGALFGFFAYSTYDLTNLATLRDWPLGIALIDVLWGAMMSGASALTGRFALDRVRDG